MEFEVGVGVGAVPAHGAHHTKNLIMSGFRFFFRVPKHQRFDYKPRYWDPRKEELEERMKRIESLQEGGVEGAKARISGGFRRGGYLSDSRVRQRQVMRSNLLLIAVVAMLLVLCYIVISIYLPALEELLN